MYSGTAMGERSVESRVCYSLCVAPRFASVSVHSVRAVMTTVEASGGGTVS